MSDIQTLASELKQRFGKDVLDLFVSNNQITMEISKEKIREIAIALRDESEFDFKMLIDVCGVDYLHYGCTEWATEETSTTGFERGVDENKTNRVIEWNKPRFAVVYHLLSISNNQRLRLKTFLKEEKLVLDSVVDIWSAADWFEREAFDLFGILFDGHPDLRRLLTDYGFVGHPFRKDFPISGNVEMRYDAKEGRVIYDPVDIEPRTLVPKVIRQDTRSQGKEDA